MAGYGKNTNDLKTWILLNEDLKTPRMINIGGNDSYDINHVVFCIVKAKDRDEAIKFMHWLHDSLRSATIIAPMVVEVKDIVFIPAKIEY